MLRSCVPPLSPALLLPHHPSHFEDLYLGFRWAFPVAASPTGFGSHGALRISKLRIYMGCGSRD